MKMEILEYANSLTKKYFAELLDKKEEELDFSAKVNEKKLKEHINFLYDNFIFTIDSLIKLENKYHNGYILSEELNLEVDEIKESFHEKLFELNYLYLYPNLIQICEIQHYTRQHDMDKPYIFNKRNLQYWTLLLIEYHKVKFNKWKLLKITLDKFLTPYIVESTFKYIFKYNDIYKSLDNYNILYDVDLVDNFLFS